MRIPLRTSPIPIAIILPEYEVYAEYWTQGAGGDNAPYTEGGSFVYISTDRVVFRCLKTGSRNRSGAACRGEVLPVSEVPEIVFSEIMRDGDLFVGVASVATDPEWMDSGQDARHPTRWDRREADEYWTRSLNADLTPTADTRRQVLQKLLPRLAGLSDRFSLEKNHVRVRGEKGEYLIHLGSAAVLRARDQRHVCIVKGASIPPYPDSVVPGLAPHAALWCSLLSR